MKVEKNNTRVVKACTQKSSRVRSLWIVFTLSWVEILESPTLLTLVSTRGAVNCCHINLLLTNHNINTLKHHHPPLNVILTTLCEPTWIPRRHWQCPVFWGRCWSGNICGSDTVQQLLLTAVLSDVTTDKLIFRL